MASNGTRKGGIHRHFPGRSWGIAGMALFLVLALTAEGSAQEFRTMDGSGNNVAHPTWGAAGTDLMRMTTASYGDGVSTPAGSTRPSARAISNAVCDQPEPTQNAAGASDFLWQWGQFVDHDIDLTETHDPVLNPEEIFDIPVPAGDPYFDPMATGTQVIPLVRSIFDPLASPRQQVNSITSFLDASNIYGSDTARGQELRLLDGSGKLHTGMNNLLPFNTDGFPNAQPAGTDPASYFLSGDIRANEQCGLTAMHTLFMREHNRLCDEIAAADPSLTGDDIYQQARRIVGAEEQVITYNEFLPLLLGPNALPAYTGYDPNVVPTISNIFSTACYRFGHSMVSSQIQRLYENGSPIEAGNLPLAQAFFSPNQIIDEGGIAPLLRGLAAQAAQENDLQMVTDLRNFLFGPPGSGGLDLAALNIQRGRDHGLPSYNQTRIDFGLAPRTSFAEVSSDPNVQAALAAAYSSVDDIDVWVGGLAEDHVPGAMVGELVYTVLVDQFTRMRDGDRFWYELEFSGQELQDLENTRLSDIIRRNTEIIGIRDDVFQMPPYRRGDCNQDDAFDIADVVHFLSWEFAGNGNVLCMDACDSNDDGLLDISDPIYMVSWLFLGGDPPQAPHTSCGQDPTADSLGCYNFTACP